MTGYIYTKKCEKGIYVGSTFDLKSRSMNHKSELEVIEEVEVEDRCELVCIENYWIDQFRQWGFDLENRLSNLSYKMGDKPPLEVKSKNIRFSEESHRQLNIFCDKKGYKLGSFCEIAALDKMKNESINNL